MQPRLKTSRQWTPLPAELIQQIKSVFHQSFQQATAGGVIEAGGRIYPGEILIRVGFRPKTGIRQSNWEISIAYKKEKDNVLKLLHLATDALGALFEQLFSAENDHDFPRLWEAVDFEGREIFVQYTTVNSQLEAEADRLLGIAEDETAVAQGDWEENITPEQIKAQLGIDPEERLDDEPLDSESEEKPKPTSARNPKPQGPRPSKRRTTH